MGSRVLGMARDMAMAFAFGAGPLMDAFTLAFRIPNLARRLFGEGALTTAFLPVFVRELEARGPGEARKVATAVTVTLGAVLLGIVLLGEVLLGGLWLLTSPGSDSQTLILLTAQMLPYLLLICLAAQASAVLQSAEQFFWPAVLPILLNVIWIAAAILAVRLFDETAAADAVRCRQHCCRRSGAVCGLLVGHARRRVSLFPPVEVGATSGSRDRHGDRAGPAGVVDPAVQQHSGQHSGVGPGASLGSRCDIAAGRDRLAARIRHRLGAVLCAANVFSFRWE